MTPNNRCDKAPFSQAALVHFRTRLIDAGLHTELLHRTVELAKQTKDFGYKNAAQLRIALDSDGLRGAGKVEDTLNLLGHALRLLLGTLALFVGLKPEVIQHQAGTRLLGGSSLKAALDLDWNEPDAQNVALRAVAAEVACVERWIAARLPRGVSTGAIDAARDTLARVLAQNTERDAMGQVSRREGVAPDRQISLSDPDMRHGRKSKNERIDGYKKYLATDLDNGLDVAAGVLPANKPEALGADKLAPQLAKAGEVGELSIDRAFLDSELAHGLEAGAGRVVCRAPGTHATERYGKKLFTIDLAAGTVTCPAGQQARINGTDARFASPTCNTCPQHDRCLPPRPRQGRRITIAPHEARNQRLAAEEKTPAGRARLRARTPIEHKLAHHARRQGPVARYRGVAKNDFDVLRIAAVNNLLAIDRRVREAEAKRARARSCLGPQQIPSESVL